jgi:hypothetical protein
MKFFVRTAGSIGTLGPVYFAVDVMEEGNIVAQLRSTMKKNLFGKNLCKDSQCTIFEKKRLIFLCDGMDLEIVLAVGYFDETKVIDCITV